MKRIIIISLFFMGIFTQNCFGQLKVDSVGHVGIGATQTKSQLTVGGNGSNDYMGYIKLIDGRHGLAIMNNATRSYHRGIYIVNANNDSSTSDGIVIMPSSYSSITTGNTYGLYCKGGGSSSKNYGIVGCVKNENNALGVGIFGSGSQSTNTNTTEQGSFAGYFLGDVKVIGALTASSLVTPSLTSLQPNAYESNTVRTYSAPDMVCDRMSSVGLLEMHVETIGAKEPQNTVSTKNSDFSKKLISELSEEELLEMEMRELDKREEPSEEDTEVVTNYNMPSTHYGLNADELKEIFPELVYEDDYGNVSINYIEMVPLLVQSIKELNAKIEELQGNGIKKAPSRNVGATSIEDTEADLFSVSQNEPNPFTESTTIKLSIPKKTQNAALMIYDMSGKQLKQININERGKTSVNITSEGLAAGMYLYSLIADGKVVNTKRMILTK